MKPFLRILFYFVVVLVGPASLALSDETPAQRSGIAPRANGMPVPKKWLPPGSAFPDRGPSDVVFPRQNLTVRMNHKLHMGKDIQATCTQCHAAAKTSDTAQDSLLPKGTTCDACHDTSHDDLSNVTGGKDVRSQCSFCHLGAENKNAPASIPAPNLHFSHKKHFVRNIGCAQCHGSVEELELATRDQLPRMKGCFACHQGSDAASRGDAKSSCETCHPRGLQGEGKIRSLYKEGVLLPPRWLHNAEHTPDFLLRHKAVAGNDSQFCANCHTERFCTDCHDGRVRPRQVHPNDYLAMHPIEARQATQKCQSCHNEQQFCLGCHQRLGITQSGPLSAMNRGRFHPPKALWSDPPRRPGHHGYEANKNLNACISCHIERDCVACHGGQGMGAGFSPHRAGFAAGCATQFQKNPRPCFVCHNPNDGALAACR